MKQTLQSFPIVDVTGLGASPSLRLAADSDFQASTLELHLAGDDQTNYRTIALTLDGTTATTDDEIIDTTDDSSDPNNATYSLYLMNSQGKLVRTLFERWAFTASWGDSVDWARLEAFNVNRAPLRDADAYSKRQTDFLITGMYAPDARTTVAGKGYASVNPASGAPTFLTVEDPSVVFTTDPRVATIGVFTHMGTVVPANGGNVGEPTVMYEPPFMLISSGFANVYKMWHTATLGTAPGDWGTPATVYKESADGQEWFPYPTSVLPGMARNHVINAGSSYRTFVSPDDHSIVQYTSPNGVTGQTLVGTVVTDGGGGWKNNSVANSSVVIDGSTWYHFFDGYNGSRWQIGVNLSTDEGATWTEYASNPVITLPAPAGVGQPDVFKIGSTWYAACQVMENGVIPSDLFLFAAPSPFGPWAVTTVEPFFPRTTQDEGVGNSVGQITGRFLEVDGRTLFFYTADVNGLVPEGHSHIKLARADMTREELVRTQGGVKLPTTAVSALSAGQQSGWTTYTPAVTASTGSITALGPRSGRYRLLDSKTVAVQMDILIATNGTGGGYVKVGLPLASGTPAYALNGAEAALNGKVLRCVVAGGGASVVDVSFYDNTYPGADGARFVISGLYEIP